MAAMPIPLRCGYDFDEESCLIDNNNNIIKPLNGGWLFSFFNTFANPLFQKIIVCYQLQPSLLCQQIFNGLFCLIIFALYHQDKITFSMINNQTFQLNVAVKTSIIGDNQEGYIKKENKITGYSK